MKKSLEGNLPRAVLVGIVHFFGVLLSKNFLALLASHDDLSCSENFMILSFHVADWAVKPQFAALGSDLHLSVENVFAHTGIQIC